MSGQVSGLADDIGNTNTQISSLQDDMNVLAALLAPLGSQIDNLIIGLNGLVGIAQIKLIPPTM